MSEEQTLFKGSSSLVIKLGTFVLCAIVFAASVVFAFLISLWLLILAGVALVFLAIQWFLIRCRVYEVTTERIRVTTGILTRRTDELELYRVKDITLIETLTERLLRVGSIRVTTTDVSTPSLEIEAIRGARDLREEMRKSVEACRERKGVRVAELE